MYGPWCFFGFEMFGMSCSRTIGVCCLVCECGGGVGYLVGEVVG